MDENINEKLDKSAEKFVDAAEPKLEEVKGKGKEILEKIKELIKEGNIRKVIIKSKDGKIIAEFPLTMGLIGVAVAPIVSAIAAIIALVSECSIYVEKNKA